MQIFCHHLCESICRILICQDYSDDAKESSYNASGWTFKIKDLKINEYNEHTINFKSNKTRQSFFLGQYWNYYSNGRFSGLILSLQEEIVHFDEWGRQNITFQFYFFSGTLTISNHWGLHVLISWSDTGMWLMGINDSGTYRPKKEKRKTGLLPLSWCFFQVYLFHTCHKLVSKNWGCKIWLFTICAGKDVLVQLKNNILSPRIMLETSSTEHG